MKSVLERLRELELPQLQQRWVMAELLGPPPSSSWPFPGVRRAAHVQRAAQLPNSQIAPVASAASDPKK